MRYLESRAARWGDRSTSAVENASAHSKLLSCRGRGQTTAVERAAPGEVCEGQGVGLRLDHGVQSIISEKQEKSLQVCNHVLASSSGTQLHSKSFKEFIKKRLSLVHQLMPCLLDVNSLQIGNPLPEKRDIMPPVNHIIPGALNHGYSR